MKLKGQVAIVTGASRGIGKRIALQLAEEGADIVLAARTVEPGAAIYPGSIQETAAEVRKRGAQALPVKCDLTVPEQTERMCRAALEHFGHVDILVNNAHHRSDQHYGMFLDIRLDTWQDTMAANVLSPVLACKTLLPQMIERRHGIIICLTSSVVTNESPNLPGKGAVNVVYSATKAALHRFAQGLVKEVREYNIPVVLIDPGFALTERIEVESQRLGGLDTSRAQSPDVPAKVARYLCTCPNPMFFTGKTIYSGPFVEEHNL
ncbi:MAG TPA: SDR family oxidoreductase [Candidatus Binataceae bacterium]|nr:SDR family oxidoreductase [Candidatus Binataceae bacterium]